MMPQMTGIDVYEGLRRQRPGSEERLAFVTGGVFDADTRQAVAATGRPCLEKPLSRAVLERVIRELGGPTDAGT